MNSRIEKIKRLREYLLAEIRPLSVEQLNRIPEGLNNNIIWNLGHLVCAQQSLCYIRAEQPIIVEEKYFKPFFTGTRPEAPIDTAGTEAIKTLFISTIDQLQTDYDRDIFKNYTASPNILRVYGMELKTIDDALEYLLYHEGIHCSSVMLIKRLIS